MTKAFELSQVPVTILDANTTGVYFNGVINTTGVITTTGTVTANTVQVSNVAQTQTNLQVDPAGTALLNAIIYG